MSRVGELRLEAGLIYSSGKLDLPRRPAIRADRGRATNSLAMIYLAVAAIALGVQMTAMRRSFG
jgi:hypothetical protein